MYKIVSLRKIARISTGFPFKGDQYSDEGIRVVRGENVTVGSLRWDTIKCWNQEFEQADKYSLKDGDVVIGMDGSKVGKNRARIRSNDLPLLLAQRVALIRMNEFSNQNFLYYLIRANKFEEYVERIQTGSSVPHISQKQIEEYPVPLIPVDIQEKIANILLSLDSKIELNNLINAELEAMAKTIYDYWFVQFDYPDKNGKPYKSSGGKMVWNDELKREIPAGWEVTSMRNLVKCNYSSLNKDSNPEKINYLDTSNLTSNLISEIQTIERSLVSIPSRAQRIVKKDDILYSTVRPNQCHFGIIKYPIDNMIASTGFAQISSIDKDLKNELLYLFLSSETIVNRLHQIASSAVSAYPSISHNDILDLQIVLPKERKILFDLNELLDSTFSKIAIRQIENQQLASLRDWLLPMLMNGQVMVN